jgi:hypothetical protein
MTSSSMPQFEKRQDYISKCELEWGAKLNRILGQYLFVNPNNVKSKYEVHLICKNFFTRIYLGPTTMGQNFTEKH